MARPQSFHRLDFMYHDSDKAMSISEASEAVLLLEVISGRVWQVPGS